MSTAAAVGRATVAESARSAVTHPPWSSPPPGGGGGGGGDDDDGAHEAVRRVSHGDANVLLRGGGRATARLRPPRWRRREGGTGGRSR